MTSESWTSADAPPQRTGAVVLRTVLGNVYLLVATVILATLAVLIGWLPPRGNHMFRIARIWSRGLLTASGVRVKASFASELNGADRGYVYLANHQSLFDIPALIATLPGQTRFLAKRSLFRIPIFGWSLAAGGFVPVDRGDRRGAAATFAAARARLAAGRSILIFPEETRSLDGNLLPFKKGGVLLALKSGFPIVPVGIRGTLAVQRKDSFAIRPGPVEVRYGEPIAAADFGLHRRRELDDELRAHIGRLAAVGG